MRELVNRRSFLNTSAAMAAGLTTSAALAADSPSPGKLLIVGVSCSPRQGKTTAQAVQIALDAAAAVSDRIETQLVDLGGLEVGGWQGGAKPDAPGQMRDDLDAILPLIDAPNLAGMIIGSPSYFRSVSALCKAFLERLYVMRSPTMRLADKPVGAIGVGSFRNGGQELVIQQILTAMQCYDVMPVGGKPNAHQGATLWNQTGDDIRQDTFGVDTAKKLGMRVAEAALRLASARNS